MYILRISSRTCLSDAKLAALRGRLASVSDYQGPPIDEDAIVVEEPTREVIARLVTNCLSTKVVTEAAELLQEVHGDLSNRGSVIYRGAMMSRERTDGSLSRSKAIPQSLLRLKHQQNARLGLTGPYSDFLGYSDKTPRHPFCRPTSWSLKRPDILEISRPLVNEVNYVYRHELAAHWHCQHDS